MQIDFEDCLCFVEEYLGYKLFDYQKIILRAFCLGLEVRELRDAPEDLRRSDLVKAFGRYITKYKCCGEWFDDVLHH